MIKKINIAIGLAVMVILLIFAVYLYSSTNQSIKNNDAGLTEGPNMTNDQKNLTLNLALNNETVKDTMKFYNNNYQVVDYYVFKGTENTTTNAIKYYPSVRLYFQQGNVDVYGLRVYTDLKLKKVVGIGLDIPPSHITNSSKF